MEERHVKKRKGPTKPWEELKEETRRAKCRELHHQVLHLCKREAVPFEYYLQRQADNNLEDLCSTWNLSNDKEKIIALLKLNTKPTKLHEESALYIKDTLLLSDNAYFTLRKAWKMEELLPSLDALKKKRKALNLLMETELEFDENVCSNWEKGWAVSLHSVITLICKLLKRSVL